MIPFFKSFPFILSFCFITLLSYSQQPPIEQINKALSETLKETNYDSIYNALGLKNGDRIKVFVNFTIYEEGKVTNIKTRAPYPFFEQEVIRLMERLPSFTPMMVDGEAKRMNFSLPITFVVEREKRKKK